MIRFSSLAVIVLLGCGGGDGAPPDAGDDGAAASLCESHSQCDDGLFCTGEERCAPDSADADASGCTPGTAPCAGAVCDEGAGACVTDCPDADGDGQASARCGGEDCDDEDAQVFLGNVEVCDAEGRDEDCDPSTVGDDGDADGFAPESCCNVQSDGSLRCGRDCNDESAGVNPGAADGCGGGDEDCDGTIDEEPDALWYRDQDNDDFGTPDDTVMSCAQPPGYAPQPRDCNDDPFEDARASDFNPGEVDVCDEEDNDCDGMIDEAFSCECRAPGSTGSCGVAPALAGVGQCQLGSHTCQDDGTFTECIGAVGPRRERCNDEDDDCDGRTDEGARITCWADPDRDGYAASGAPTMEACSCPDAFTERDPATEGADCDPNEATTYPGAPEICDRIDSDCSRAGDSRVEAAEDRDSDGHTAEDYTRCEGGFPKDDCHDGNDEVHPGASYQTTGYCPRGTCRCGDQCRPVRGALGCVIGCSATDDSTDPIFDYDCDGEQERRPVASCPGFCGPGFGCPGVVPAYSGRPRCGSFVPHRNCGGGACPCSNTNVSRRLGCR